MKLSALRHPRTTTVLDGVRPDLASRRHRKTPPPPGRPGLGNHELIRAIEAMHMRRGRAWSVRDGETLDELRERAIQFEEAASLKSWGGLPVWATDELLPASQRRSGYGQFLALLLAAYRRGRVGLFLSYQECRALVGVGSDRTWRRWCVEWEALGLVRIVQTWRRGDQEGRRRSYGRLLYRIGPAWETFAGPGLVEGSTTEGGKVTRAWAARCGAGLRRRARVYRSAELARLRAPEAVSDPKFAPCSTLAEAAASCTLTPEVQTMPENAPDPRHLPTLALVQPPIAHHGSLLCSDPSTLPPVGCFGAREQDGRETKAGGSGNSSQEARALRVCPMDTPEPEDPTAGGHPAPFRGPEGLDGDRRSVRGSADAGPFGGLSERFSEFLRGLSPRDQTVAGWIRGLLVLGLLCVVGACGRVFESTGEAAGSESDAGESTDHEDPRATRRAPPTDDPGDTSTGGGSTGEGPPTDDPGDTSTGGGSTGEGPPTDDPGDTSTGGGSTGEGPPDLPACPWWSCRAHDCLCEGPGCCLALCSALGGDTTCQGMPCTVWCSGPVICDLGCTRG